MKRIDTLTHPNISKHFPFDPQVVPRMEDLEEGGLDVASATSVHGGAVAS